VGITADALVHRADSAMYSGKRQGKGVAVHYCPEVTPDMRRDPDRAGVAEPPDAPGLPPRAPEVVADAPPVRRRIGSVGTRTR
jgi:hypothetical protein